MARPCLGAPGDPCGIPTDGRRCPRHVELVDRPRERRHHNRAYDVGRGKRRRAAAVRAHRREHGDWCPGYGRPAHPSSDLTADDVVPLARGGSIEGELAVLCRSCNGRKGGR